MARKPKKPIEMSRLLNSSSGTLAYIQTKTNSLTTLATIVRQICPDLPAEAWHIANFEKNTVIIEVKSPVWGQRFQFERNKICQHLTENTQGEFDKIEIKINPYSHDKQKTVTINNKDNQTSPKSNVISATTAKHLESLAINAPNGLREKLLKLALHGKKQ